MDDYRKKMAAKYAALPQEDKPHVKKCEDCGEADYKSKVCMVSGRLHGMDHMKLLGATAVEEDKKLFNGPELMTAINASRIKSQKARTELVQIDQTASDSFQSFVRLRNWQLMRIGIMYGVYDKFTKKLSVHAVYEPEQEGNATGYALQPDPREKRVDQLAEMLGFHRVGIMVTHQARDTKKGALAGVEVLLTAREQSRFGDHCVLVTFAPNSETKNVGAEAWQVSEQAVHLFQMGVLAPHPDQLAYVRSHIALETAKEEVEENQASANRGKTSLKVMAPTNDIESDYFTCYMGIEQFHSDVCHNGFVRISRPGDMPPTFQNLEIYLKDAKRANKPFHEKICDFHVLIFLMENMFGGGVEDMKPMVEAMLKKDAVGMAKYEAMILQKMKR